MYQKRSKAPRYCTVIVALGILGYYMGILAGYAITDDQKISIDALLIGIEVLSESPLIWEWNQYSMYCIAGASFSGIIWALYDSTQPDKYRDGYEYGSVIWGNVKKTCKRLSDRKNPKNNRILSAHMRVSYDTRHTDLNNNGIWIGGSGSSKSFRGVSPNLYNSQTYKWLHRMLYKWLRWFQREILHKTPLVDEELERLKAGLQSFVVTDPKGELLARHGRHLEKDGYNIKVFNLIKPDNSDRYNPFPYIRSEKDIYKLATNFIQNTEDKKANRGDGFWTDSAKNLFAALCLYVWLEVPGPEQSLPTVAELMEKVEKLDDGEMSEMDLIIDDLPDKHPAKVAYQKALKGPVDTIMSVISVLNSRLSSITTSDIKRLLSTDDMNIAELGIGEKGDQKTRTAIFLVIPDNDQTFNYLVGMFYTQMFQELYYQADMVFGGSLPIPVNIWMDEFANISLPDGFVNLEATMRSRNISVQVILQNLSQLESLFKDSWETILSNADTMVFLGGNDKKTLEYISQKLGNETIDKRSDSQTRGKNGSTSVSHDHMQHSLMSPDEINRMCKKKCIIFIRGEYPMIDDKYETLTDRIFLKFKGLRYEHPVRIKRDRQGNIIESNIEEKPAVTPLSQESLQYYRNAEAAGDNVVVYDVSAQDLFAFTADEITLQIRDKYFHPEKEKAKDPEVGSKKPKRYLQQSNKEKQSLHELLNTMVNYHMSPEQQKQVMLGYRNGLTEEEILLYADIDLTPEQMEKKRIFIQGVHNKQV